MAGAQSFTADRIADVLPRGSVLVGGCSGGSALLAEAVMAAGEAIGAVTFTGIVVPGLNRATWLANDQSRFETFFMTPELKAAGDRVRFLPLPYTDILARWRREPPDAALFSVTPPDADGLCSFGPTVDFLSELWPLIPHRIALVNPLLPRTHGPTGIPIDAIDAVLEAPEPLPTLADNGSDPITTAIAARVAAHVPNGATLQTGIGKLPGAVLAALRGHRNLRIHSGLIGDAVLDLVEGGAIAQDDHVVTGVAIGSDRLYAALPERGFQFRPVSHTHAPAVLAAIPGLLTINSALSVDLFGQAYAEVGPRGWLSGTGGATEFVRGARAAGGLRIVALPSSAKGASRIGAAAGPVTLGRMDTDVVVTEHGAADLRGLDHDERAAALIAVAAPEHRDVLARAWCDGPGTY